MVRVLGSKVFFFLERRGVWGEGIGGWEDWSSKFKEGLGVENVKELVFFNYIVLNIIKGEGK